jgi:hypothetical protein
MSFQKHIFSLFLANFGTVATKKNPMEIGGSENTG